MLYLHETFDVRPDRVEEFGPSLAALYRPAMWRRQGPVLGVVETMAFSACRGHASSACGRWTDRVR